MLPRRGASWQSKGSPTCSFDIDRRHLCTLKPSQASAGFSNASTSPPSSVPSMRDETMASSPHESQPSLQDISEGMISFSGQPLGADERTDAKRRFYRIINHIEANSSASKEGYNRPRLVCLTYEYMRSEVSRDTFLQSFFNSIGLEIAGDDDDISFGDGKLEENVCSFANYLIDNFFLPLKISGRRSPQPSPIYHAATPTRLSTLRGACLVRDRHRCVISRRFDLSEATARGKRDSLDAKDDDGNFLMEERVGIEPLEVAHILPHSLCKVNAESKLDGARPSALVILNMFDDSVAHLTEGNEIDRPRNAITLGASFHLLFGNFEVFFTPTADGKPHSYRVESFLPAFITGSLPVTCYLAGSPTIDPPLPRFLAIHSAIAHILQLSAAGEYIDKVLRGMEQLGVQADGSTELGRFVSLRFGGWVDSAVVGAY